MVWVVGFLVSFEIFGPSWSLWERVVHLHRAFEAVFWLRVVFGSKTFYLFFRVLFLCVPPFFPRYSKGTQVLFVSEKKKNKGNVAHCGGTLSFFCKKGDLTHCITCGQNKPMRKD